MAPRAPLLAVVIGAVLLGCAGEPDAPPQDSLAEPVDHLDERVEDDEPADQSTADQSTTDQRTDDQPTDDTASPPAPPDDESDGSSSSDVDELPEAPDAAAAYEQSPEEVYPNAKTLATAIAQAVTTYDPGEVLVDAVAGLELRAPDAEALAGQAAVLHHEDHWSRGRAVYAQLGGVTATDVSVMVVTEQMLGGADGVRTQTRTLDVRLTVTAGRWEFTQLADAGGRPPESQHVLSEQAERVLGDDRIELPDSARWDILSGHTDPALLELMSRAADEFSFGVVTLHSGHPTNVFGTERASNHTRGLAVDIYAVEGTAVIDDRADDSTTSRFVQWLYEQPEVMKIGSPWALDDYGGRSFTDVVHQDHLHVAVQPRRGGDR